MKKLLVLVLLSLSATAFSQTCYVNMVDRYDRVVRTFAARGSDTCLEAMKECRKSIRLDYSRDPQYPNGSLDCVRVGDTTPLPPTNPFPRQTDNNRQLNNGETVIYHNSYYTVVGTAFNGTVALRSTWNYNITQGIRREDVAVTNGCNLNVCVGDSVINISTASYATVSGLTFHDGFVLKNTWNSTLSTVDQFKVALTKGCTYGGYNQICVGNQVLASNNTYYTVVAIQLDNRVVLKSNYSSSLSVNIDPSSLIVVR